MEESVTVHKLQSSEQATKGQNGVTKSGRGFERDEATPHMEIGRFMVPTSTVHGVK